MLRKEYIRSNKSSYVASVLIMKKLNEDLRVCIDYRALNALTVKDRNVSSLIKKIMTRLCAARIYNKFNIIIAFNEIRMKKNHEERTIFLTRYELFEYVIMLFDLCNASEIF